MGIHRFEIQRFNFILCKSVFNIENFVLFVLRVGNFIIFQQFSTCKKILSENDKIYGKIYLPNLENNDPRDLKSSQEVFRYFTDKLEKFQPFSIKKLLIF